MKLLLVGHSVLDFTKSDKDEKISAGGIYYSISTLNRISNIDDEIYLCSQFDEETYNYFQPEFEKVNRDYLRRVEKIPRVHLNLVKGQERHESYENITNNLEIEYSNKEEFDGIVINMITGFDITSNQIQKIRNNYSGLIFLDVHTLSRGLSENYKREFRRIPNFNLWAKCVDIIQVNQNELLTLSDKKNEFEIVYELFNQDIKILCVTKGELGAKIYYKKSDEIISYFWAARKINNPNVIGCGDVFGTVFFYNYIRNRNRNEIESLREAVETAELHVNNKLL
jgi:sugar/nucleoside kinase (ribokinase family)